MVNECEICQINNWTSLLTRCCKLFICRECKDRLEKVGICQCGKTISKKLCNESDEVFNVVEQFYNGKIKQCDRCNEQAQIQCKQCQMVYCNQCNSQVHIGKGFLRHYRETYKSSKSNERIQQKRNKQQWCNVHAQLIESICDCGQMICNACVRLHRQNCKLRLKPIKQYKQEYFAQILFKLKQITEFKQRLKKSKLEYQKHFIQQTTIQQQCKIILKEQMNSLKLLLEIKIEQNLNELKDYWLKCQNVYQQTINTTDKFFKQYDDYAKLLQKFAEKSLALQYFDKRIKPIIIPQDFYAFKSVNVEEVNSVILGLTTQHNNWQPLIFNNIQNNQKYTQFKQFRGMTRKNDLSINNNSNSQLLLQYSLNPLKPREMSLCASHNQIQFEFIHLPYLQQIYQIEYGLGFKMKGQQVFKKIENYNGTGIIFGLNASTKYRLRMRVVNGNWGNIFMIKTLQVSKFAVQNSNICRTIGENSFMVLKLGTVYGTNAIFFGIHRWNIRILCQKGYDDNETACISIGVSNREQKKPIFVGSTFNYGYQTDEITVKIQLNCEQNKLIIWNSTNLVDQNFTIPSLPLYPTVHNKSANSVQIKYSFQGQDQ